MRGFSKVYSNVWQSGKFNRLSDPAAKLAYLYLLTSPHSNSSGCFDIKIGYATADLEYTEQSYRMAIDSLVDVGLIEVAGEYRTYLITNWVEFNEPTNAKHSLGIMNHLNAASHWGLKVKRAQEFISIMDAKKHSRDPTCGATLERLCKPYRMAIEPLSSPQTKTQTPDTEGDLDQTRPIPETREENSRTPHSAVAALTGDGLAASGRGEPDLPDIPQNLDRRNRLLNTGFLKGAA